jgi:choice-of-anchor A domain-containing protein
MIPSTNRSLSTRTAGRGLHACILLICMAFLSGTSAANIVYSDLGAAGPGNWAILIGPNTTDFALNGPGTTIGNVGYDGAFNSTLQLNASGGYQAIDGNLYLAPGDTVNNAAQVTGSVLSNISSLDADWAAAVAASAGFSALAPTQSVVGSQINGTMTINATTTTNVIGITSLNLGNGQTLTLNGSASDEFIINVSGSFVLNSGKILLTGGLTADNVVFNVTASGNAVQTSGGLNNESVVDGILLAPNSGIAFAPGLVNGELIAGGSTVHLVSGGSADGFTASVPEPSTYFLMAGGLLALARFRRK